MISNKECTRTIQVVLSIELSILLRLNGFSLNSLIEHFPAANPINLAS
jgi:hypothetical protein